MKFAFPAPRVSAEYVKSDISVLPTVSARALRSYRNFAQLSQLDQLNYTHCNTVDVAFQAKQNSFRRNRPNETPMRTLKPHSAQYSRQQWVTSSDAEMST